MRMRSDPARAWEVRHFTFLGMIIFALSDGPLQWGRSVSRVKDYLYSCSSSGSSTMFELPVDV